MPSERSGFSIFTSIPIHLFTLPIPLVCSLYNYPMIIFGLKIRLKEMIIR